MSRENFKLEEKELANNYLEKVAKQAPIVDQETAYWNYRVFIQKMDDPDEELKGLVLKTHKEAKLRY